MKLSNTAMVLFGVGYALASSLTPLALASEGGVGNGGDICEDRIQLIADDIASWIQKGGSARLILPWGISLEQYGSKMLAEIAKAQVSCTDNAVTIEDAEKTCENFVDSNGVPWILCNRYDFMGKTNQSDQYVLIHHEYAGLAGFEINKGESSHYPISNQISGFLVDEIVKKLAVQPTHAGNCSGSICVGMKVVVDESIKMGYMPGENKGFAGTVTAIYPKGQIGVIADIPSADQYKMVQVGDIAPLASGCSVDSSSGQKLCTGQRVVMSYGNGDSAGDIVGFFADGTAAVALAGFQGIYFRAEAGVDDLILSPKCYGGYCIGQKITVHTSHYDNTLTGVVVVQAFQLDGIYTDIIASHVPANPSYPEDVDLDQDADGEIFQVL